MPNFKQPKEFVMFGLLTILEMLNFPSLPPLNLSVELTSTLSLS